MLLLARFHRRKTSYSFLHLLNCFVRDEAQRKAQQYYYGASGLIALRSIAPLLLWQGLLCSWARLDLPP
jgi:hypothetical protein